MVSVSVSLPTVIADFQEFPVKVAEVLSRGLKAAGASAFLATASVAELDSEIQNFYSPRPSLAILEQLPLLLWLPTLSWRRLRRL